MPIFVGIDPGLRSGAIASIDHNGEFIWMYDIPAIEDKIDVRQLKELIYKITVASDSFSICIENVATRPNQGIASTGRFMRAAGAIEAVSQLVCDQVEWVRPQVWKKFFGLGADKFGSLELARQMWPTANLKLQKHHNLAEALLIAEYGRKTYG